LLWDTNKANICGTYITPKLRLEGWNNNQIGEQPTFTDDYIMPSGRHAGTVGVATAGRGV